MDKLEKVARVANLISLFFCSIVFLINSVQSITFFIIVLAVIQIIHLIFGDVTDSYRLLRKRNFLKIYTATLVVFSILDLLILFVFEFNLTTRIYFLSILLSFITDFAANKIRVRRLNKKQLNKIKKKKRDK